MSLNFKSFIKNKFLFLIFIPSIILDVWNDSRWLHSMNLHGNHFYGAKLEGQKDWMSRVPDGLMPAPPHDETGHTWHHSDKYLFMITKYGIEDIIGQKYPNNMPAYKDILSDKEIISVLSYIKSTWPNKVKKIHDQINDREKSK